MAVYPNPLESNKIIEFFSAKKHDKSICPFCETTNVMSANRATRRASKGRANAVVVHKPGCPKQPRPTFEPPASGEKPAMVKR